MNAAATPSKSAFAPYPKITPTLPCPCCCSGRPPIGVCSLCKGSRRVPMDLKDVSRSAGSGGTQMRECECQECMEEAEQRVLERIILFLALCGLVWYVMGGAGQ